MTASLYQRRSLRSIMVSRAVAMIWTPVHIGLGGMVVGSARREHGTRGARLWHLTREIAGRHKRDVYFAGGRGDPGAGLAGAMLTSPSRTRMSTFVITDNVWLAGCFSWRSTSGLVRVNGYSIESVKILLLCR